MYTHVARVQLPGTFAFRTWPEGRELWDRVTDAVPGLVALVLMPDHLHLLHPADVRLRLAQALSGYVRWRNHARGERGGRFAPLPPAQWLADRGKVSRSLRYVHLNPCRAELVPDPLCWPLSTHRDATGLAAFPVVPKRRDPERFHSYVSADPTVNPLGTELPTFRTAVPTPREVLYAVSAATRTPLSRLPHDLSARDLYLRAARRVCAHTHAEIAAEVGLSRFAVLRRETALDPDLRVIERILGDERFEPLCDGDLALEDPWRRYRERRLSWSP